MFLSNLGEALRIKGRLHESLAVIKRAIELAPTFSEAHYNYGIVNKQLGHDDVAVTSFRKALELKPKHRNARFALANLLREQGRLPMARREYQQIVEQYPQWFEPRLNFGVTLSQLGECDEAIKQHMIAYAINPNMKAIGNNIGDIYVKQGRPKEALEWYRRAAEGCPRNWLRELRTETLGEIIASSNEAIVEYRAHVLATLDRFQQETLEIDTTQLHHSLAEPPILQTYQGYEDRTLREKYPELYAPLIPPLDPKRPAGKPSIGVVVSNGHEGVFGRCLGELLDRINKKI